MSKPLKVAFATEDLQQVDAHFGWARNIAIYDITADSSTLATVVRFEGDLKEDGTEDKLGAKLEAIQDCAIVYVAAIGGSAAARVVNMKIHPVKVPNPEPIIAIIGKLQAVLKGTPPPWLRKALMKDQERNFDDALEEEKSHV